MKKILFIVSIVAMAVINNSCATMFGGAKQKNVIFNSKPLGAVVQDRKGEILCITPCATHVKPNAWSNFTKVTMSHEGNLQDFYLINRPNPLYYLNFLNFPLTPFTMTVDILTGAAWRDYPNNSLFANFETRDTNFNTDVTHEIPSVSHTTSTKSNLPSRATQPNILADSNELATKKGTPILPRAGSRALGVDASPFLMYTAGILSKTIQPVPTFNGVTFYRKKFLKDDVARRFGMFLNGKYEEILTADTNGINQNISNLDVVVFMGREKRLNLIKNTRLQGFSGVDFALGLGSAGKRYAYGYNKSIDTNWRPNLYKPGIKFSIGVSTFVGVEYFIAPGIAIGGQVGYGANFTVRGDRKLEEERQVPGQRYRESRTAHTTRQPNEFNLGNFGGGITLMFYF